MNYNLAESSTIAKQSTFISRHNEKTIKHLCAGESVPDLAAAVKELLENSIDSNATCIEVRFVDNGLTSITVTDNGSGIEESNFDKLGLKHHTSKLRKFSELLSITTFGFRGQALNSLCLSSHVSITTKHRNNESAHTLQFDTDGKLQDITKCNRVEGTTVSVDNIFIKSPVRRQYVVDDIEFQFSTALHFVYELCFVSAGIKILCTNKVGASVERRIISSTGAATVLDNIHYIFGRNRLFGVHSVILVEPDEETKIFYNINPGLSVQFTWKFHVSTENFSKRRDINEHQYMFVNNRPCDILVVFDFINFLYRLHFGQKHLIFSLELTTDKFFIIGNLSPDKREIDTVFPIRLVLATLKSSLVKHWAEMGHSVSSMQADVSEEEIQFRYYKYKSEQQIRADLIRSLATMDELEYMSEDDFDECNTETEKLEDGSIPRSTELDSSDNIDFSDIWQNIPSTKKPPEPLTSKLHIIRKCLQESGAWSRSWFRYWYKLLDYVNLESAVEDNNEIIIRFRSEITDSASTNHEFGVDVDEPPGNIGPRNDETQPKIMYVNSISDGTLQMTLDEFKSCDPIKLEAWKWLGFSLWRNEHKLLNSHIKLSRKKPISIDGKEIDFYPPNPYTVPSTASEISVNSLPDTLLNDDDSDHTARLSEISELSVSLGTITHPQEFAEQSAENTLEQSAWSLSKRSDGDHADCSDENLNN